MPGRLLPDGDPKADDLPEDDAKAEMADRTIVDVRASEAMTSTDVPTPPPFPYGQEMSDKTRTELPAPPPFPYAQQIPEARRTERIAPPPAAAPPAASPQAPPTQSPPPGQVPPVHEPFPYAQQMPGSPAQPAPGPFPWEQKIPGTPSAPPPPVDGPPAVEPFPWAQQMPGMPPPGQESVHPMAPPPVIEEPWRTGTQGGSARRRKSIKQPLLIGAAALAAVAVVAAGVIVVPGLLDDDDGGGAGARLAGAVFPMDGAARTDGRDQRFTGAAAAGSTVVAVGSETGPSRSRELFLVSTDGGRTFTTAKVQGADGATPAVPQVVGGSPAGWIAIGAGRDTGAVWTSPDGRTWTRQPAAVGRVFGPGNRVNQIVATGSGYLAIGAKSEKGDFSDAEPALWTSADGRQWETRVGDQIGLEVKKASYSLVEAAASGGTVLLKALIKPDNKKPPQYRKVWRSKDGGRTWAVSEVPVPKGSRGLAVGGGAAGFLAVREMKKGKKFYGQAFVSKDGESWSEAGTLAIGGYNYTRQILGGAKGFTALVSGGGNVMLVRSTDGRSWNAAGTVTGRPGRKVAAAATAGGQTVLVGQEPGGGDMDPLLSVWDAAGKPVPVDPAKISGVVRRDQVVQSAGASDALAVAVGSAAGDAAIWTSADGGTWKSAQGLGAAFTRPGPQRLLDVTPGKAGWLAVGYDRTAPKRPLVVTSADGAAWQAVDATTPFKAGKSGALASNAAAAGAAGYVVVGTEGRAAAAWFSADLKHWERGSGADPTVLKGKEAAARHWMVDVAAAGSGFIAVGGVEETAVDHPVVWSSSDGRKWSLQKLPLPDDVIDGHLTHVAAKGRTLVAAGIASTKQGPVWIGYVSTDGGRSWRDVPAPGDKKIIVTALTGTPKGFAATAVSGPAGSTDVVSMTSSDGSAWKAAKPGGTGLGGDGDQQISGLTAFKNTLLGVGRSVGARGDQPVLWSRPVS